MGKTPQIDHELTLNPDMLTVIKFTAKLFHQCMQMASDGTLRTSDTNFSVTPVTKNEIWGLENYLDFIGGPEVIRQTKETFEGIAETARILTEIQSRIEACQKAIEDNAIETSFYKLMVLGNPKLASQDILSISLRKAIETYASPKAFGITTEDILVFERMLEPVLPVSTERLERMRTNLLRRVHDETKNSPKSPEPR